MTNAGITTPASETPIPITEADLQSLQIYMEGAFPKALRMVDNMHIWNNTTGKDTIAKAHWLEQGVQLKTRENYANITIDPNHIPERRGKQFSPAVQQENYINDLIKVMDAKNVTAPKAQRGPLTRKGGKAQLSDIGILQKQTGSDKPIIIRDALMEFANHVDSVANYSAKAVPIRDAQAVLSNPEFRRAITETFRDGPQRLKAMQGAVDDLGGMNFTSSDSLGRVANGIL